MKHLTFILLVILISIGQFCLNASAQDSLEESIENINSNRSSDFNGMDEISNRSAFTSTVDSINVYKADKRFEYVYYLDSVLKKTKIPVETVSSESFNDKTKSSGQRKETDLKNSNNVLSNSLVRIILWILAFCFISYILYRLFLAKRIFRREYRQATEAAEAAEKNSIENSDYDVLINETVNNKNFRLAIRYLYLQTLQKLFAAGLLQSSADKTNYQYLKELRSIPGHDEFSLLTLDYEYVWYGEFIIDGETYSQIEKRFKKYHQKF